MGTRNLGDDNHGRVSRPRTKDSTMFIAGDAPTDVGNGNRRESDDRTDSIIRWEPERTGARTLVDTLVIVAAGALVAAGVTISLTGLV